MDAFEFTCPHCSGRLRVRQRMFVGRQVNCPDCNQPLLITEHKGQLAVEPVAVPSPARVENTGGQPVTKLALPGAKSALSTWSRSPPLIAWTAAGICVTGLFSFLLLRNPGGVPRTDTPETFVDDRNSTPNTASTDAVADQSANTTAAPKEAMNGTASSQETVAPNSVTPKGKETEIAVAPATTTNSTADAANPSNAIVALSDEKPIDPEFAEPPPPEPARPKTEAEISAALKQPILAFQQAQSAPLAEVLREVAAMAGAAVKWDAAELGSAESRLDQPVKLRLDKTTVGTILDKLLEPAKLTYRIEPGTIRIVMKPQT